MTEIILGVTLLATMVLAYIAVKKEWKITDFF